jgi:hypothetical protein
LAGETEVLGENLPSATFVYHKIPHDQTRLWTRAAAVGSQRLTAWAMARPLTIGLLYLRTALIALVSVSRHSIDIGPDLPSWEWRATLEGETRTKRGGLPFCSYWSYTETVISSGTRSQWTCNNYYCSGSTDFKVTGLQLLKYRCWCTNVGRG